MFPGALPAVIEHEERVVGYAVGVRAPCRRRQETEECAQCVVQLREIRIATDNLRVNLAQQGRKLRRHPLPRVGVVNVLEDRRYFHYTSICGCLTLELTCKRQIRSAAGGRATSADPLASSAFVRWRSRESGRI